MYIFFANSDIKYDFSVNITNVIYEEDKHLLPSGLKKLRGRLIEF